MGGWFATRTIPLPLYYFPQKQVKCIRHSIWVGTEKSAPLPASCILSSSLVLCLAMRLSLHEEVAMSIDEKMLLQDKILGVLIQDARQAVGKTQKECAAFLNMSADMLSDIEYGERSISLPELEVLAYLLDVPVEHFLDSQLLETVEEKPFPVDELLILRNRVIGVLLRQARMAADMTQEECGKTIDVSGSLISAYEHGQAAVPYSELETLAEALQVPLETFLDNENNPIAKMVRQDRASEQLDHLPEEIQAFLLDPLNTDYIHTAMHLSTVPAGKLRNIAETLLEITY